MGDDRRLSRRDKRRSSPISVAEYWIQARTSSRASEGYSCRTSSIESPAPRNSRMVCAVIRVPRIIGRPLQILGSITIRSFIRLKNKALKPARQAVGRSSRVAADAPSVGQGNLSYLSYYLSLSISYNPLASGDVKMSGGRRQSVVDGRSRMEGNSNGIKGNISQMGERWEHLGRLRRKR